MMNPEKYNGYKVTLTTPLTIEECRSRLLVEFRDATGRSKMTRSDRTLYGRVDGNDFRIYSPTSQAVEGDSRLRARVFRGQLQPGEAGTMILGRYGYEQGSAVAVSDIHRFLLVIVVSFVCVVFGLIGTIGSAGRWLPGFAVVLLGIVGIVVPLRMLLTPNDKDFRHERDHIAAYLMKVLRPE